MTTATLGTAGQPAVASDGGSDTGAEALPSWFVVALVVALAAVVGFGTVGLALGVAGAFVPVPTLALGLVATLALVAGVAPWRFPAARDRAAQVPAVLAVGARGGGNRCSRCVTTRSTCCSIAIRAATC